MRSIKSGSKDFMNSSYSSQLEDSYNTHVCCAKSLQICLTLCDPMDYSPPGCSVHGILQARILEWVAALLHGIFWTQGSNPCLLCLLHWQVHSLPLVTHRKPLISVLCLFTLAYKFLIFQLLISLIWILWNVFSFSSSSVSNLLFYPYRF